MPTSIVFMFSGQGCQYYQMGRELFEFHRTFRAWMLRLDSILRDIAGESVLDHLYDRTKTKGDTFDRTLHTHPAIFMVEYALAQVLIEAGVEPRLVLGTSLGEFAAAAVAGAISFHEALEGVVRQAVAVETRCESGGMLAILRNASLYPECPPLRANSELASVNFPSHFVVSGRRENLRRIEGHLIQEGIAFQTLPVSHAFHSSFIEPAASTCTSYLHQVSYRTPQMQFLSCSDPSVMTDLGGDHLWQAVRRPVQFQRAIEQLERRQSYVYVDVGPSGTLATFVKYNLDQHSASTQVTTLTPFARDLDGLERAKALLLQQAPARPRPERSR